MTKRFGLIVGLGLSAALLSSASFAAGLWPDFPVLGGGSYCGSTNQPGGPGTATQCTNTVPAGPATSTGLEQIPSDTRTVGGGAQTVLVPTSTLGFGARSDVASPATATIPINTPYYFLDGAQASAFTLTMPAGAALVDGYIQRVVCTSATVGALTVAANTSQTVKNNPSAACVAGVGYAWIWNAANTTWYRFQ